MNMTFLVISDIHTQIFWILKYWKTTLLTPFSLTYFTHPKQTFILRTEISLH